MTCAGGAPLRPVLNFPEDFYTETAENCVRKWSSRTFAGERLNAVFVARKFLCFVTACLSETLFPTTVSFPSQSKNA
jgi:hypothetical protein